MILKNVYFRKIELKDDSTEEFKQKLGEALDILDHATEDSYNQMGIDAEKVISGGKNRNFEFILIDNK